MDALRSTALVPGEPEFKSEYNLLNMLLYKIPKHVDIRQILKAKPLQPRHSSALQELHLELFPIRYDPRFFEIACSTECGYFNSKSFWDVFDFKRTNSTDSEWSDNQFMSIGLFLPRSYVSFFRKTGEYEVDKYLQYLVEDDEYTEFDDPLTQMVVYDFEYDEFMVGFVTLLINMDVTNTLISDDDYNILTSFFKNQLLPAIHHKCVTVNKNNNSNNNNKENTNEENKEKEKDTEETEKTKDKKEKDGEDKEKEETNKESNEVKYVYNEEDEEDLVNKIRKCIRLNESLFDDSLYSFFYNQLYTNELLLEYASKFTTKSAKSLYILSTGITLGLRSRSLGTNLILFLQVLIYFINHGLYIFKDKYYRLFDQKSNSNNKSRDYYSNYTDCNELDNLELKDNFDNYRNILNVIKNYYNNKVFSVESIYTYYNYVLDSNYVPYNCDHIINNYFENKKFEYTLGDFCRKRATCPSGFESSGSKESNKYKEFSEYKDFKEYNESIDSNKANKSTQTNESNEYNMCKESNEYKEYTESIDSNKANKSSETNEYSETSESNKSNEYSEYKDCKESSGYSESDEYTEHKEYIDCNTNKELLDLLEEEMPLVIYLHTIYYNEFATRVYENLNFYHIATIPDYYYVNNKKYDARFLAYYMYL